MFLVYLAKPILLLPTLVAHTTNTTHLFGDHCNHASLELHCLENSQHNSANDYIRQDVASHPPHPPIIFVSCALLPHGSQLWVRFGILWCDVSSQAHHGHIVGQIWPSWRHWTEIKCCGSAIIKTNNTYIHTFQVFHKNASLLKSN